VTGAALFLGRDVGVRLNERKMRDWYVRQISEGVLDLDFASDEKIRRLLLVNHLANFLLRKKQRDFARMVVRMAA